MCPWEAGCSYSNVSDISKLPSISPFPCKGHCSKFIANLSMYIIFDCELVIWIFFLKRRCYPINENVNIIIPVFLVFRFIERTKLSINKLIYLICKLFIFLGWILFKLFLTTVRLEIALKLDNVLNYLMGILKCR